MPTFGSFQLFSPNLEPIKSHTITILLHALPPTRTPPRIAVSCGVSTPPCHTITLQPRHTDRHIAPWTQAADRLPQPAWRTFWVHRRTFVPLRPIGSSRMAEDSRTFFWHWAHVSVEVGIIGSWVSFIPPVPLCVTCRRNHQHKRPISMH